MPKDNVALSYLAIRKKKTISSGGRMSKSKEPGYTNIPLILFDLIMFMVGVLL